LGEKVMRRLLLAILTVATAISATAPSHEEWTDVVGDIRARLVVVYHPDIAQAQRALIFLELQNFGPSKEVWLNRGVNLRWKCVDERGVSVYPDEPGLQRQQVDFVVLPPDSILRFRVREIPRKQHGRYALGAELVSYPPEGKFASAWRGHLVLPTVEVVAKE
jgi:hypothetical protein